MAYARALGGVSFDQSFRLEPTQVAGFNQAFRSLIPESVTGPSAAEDYETWGLSLEQTFQTGTYVGLAGEILRSDVDRWLGTYDSSFPFAIDWSQTREKLDYEERTLLLTLNQLLSQEWSLGARYRLSHAQMQSYLPNIAESLAPPQDVQSFLHQVNLFATFNHRSGFFGQFGSVWNQQSNQGYSPDRPGDEFWQFNVLGGYRFYQRRAELTLGVLNLTDQDYKLNPLNLTPEYPRGADLAGSV